MIGTTLDHFELTAKLGEGGMGTVYRGRDTRLGREVAIKVLPEAFIADPERLARFEREAKLLASLNHPNIAGIYEVGEAVPQRQGRDPSTPLPDARSARDDDSATEPALDASPVHYLVMELAEGEDLAERLRRGPLPLDESLAIAIQIAKALEAAHARGIVHRDLKPANVKLAPDGGVKVLDFGLAKAFDSGPGGGGAADLTRSPTLTAQMTSAGMILGTAAYMSPEQAKGEEADKRSDIWSFGVVLWEMLAGRKTFDERTVSETLAAVLKSDPDHSLLPANLPLGARRLIERCLEKEPERRLHDIADARLELEAVLRGDDSAALLAAPGAAAPAASRGWRIAAIVAALVALASLALHFLPDETRSLATLPPVRFAIDRPPAYMDGSGPGLAIAPDGTKVAYWAKNEAGDDQIFLRRLDRVESEPIAGTEGGKAPFFSPDGNRLGFWDGSGIYSVSLHGGAPKLLTEIQNFRGAVWAPGDTIWFSPDTEAGLWRMRSDGSNVERVTSPDAERGERSHRWPALLPGGDVLLFTVATAEISRFDDARIDAFRLSTGEQTTILEGGMYPVFLPPDTLFYAVAGTLMAVTLDPETLEIDGPPAPLVDGVKTAPLSGIAAVAVATDGSLVTGLGEPLVGARRLVEYDRDGASHPITDEIRPFQALALSPDESTLALDIDAANAAIWLLDLERGIETRLTTRWSHNLPVWSPDGAALLSSSSRGGSYQIDRHRIATGESDILYESREQQSFATSWSVDGLVAATMFPAGESSNIWVFPVDDPASAHALVAGPFAEYAPKFSPDGQWVAFVSNESGSDEIYVVPSDGSGAKIRVSSAGGVDPVWSHREDELYYWDGTSLMVAAVTPGDRLRIGVPRPLFRLGRIYSAGLMSSIDVTRDGRFLINERADVGDQTAMDLVLSRHWLGELRQKLHGD